MSDVAREAWLSAGGTIPIAPCPSCERDVVIYLVESGASETWACTHCDRVVRGLEWIEESELVRLGYAVSDPLAAGCATGCATGGCTPRPRTIDDILATYRKL